MLSVTMTVIQMFHLTFRAQLGKLIQINIPTAYPHMRIATASLKKHSGEGYNLFAHPYL